MNAETIEKQLLSIATFFDKNEDQLIGLFCDVADITEISGRIRAFLRTLEKYDGGKQIKAKVLANNVGNSALWQNGVIEIIKTAKKEKRRIKDDDALTIGRNIAVLINIVTKYMETHYQ